MKRLSFMFIFVTTQVFLIVLQIYKQSHRIQLFYEKQKNETYKAELLLKRQELTQQLYALKDHGRIKQYAEQELKMQPVKLGQIQKMTVTHDQPS